MTLTIELPEEQEAALKVKAQAQGVSAEEYCAAGAGPGSRTEEPPAYF